MSQTCHRFAELWIPQTSVVDIVLKCPASPQLPQAVYGVAALLAGASVRLCRALRKIRKQKDSESEFRAKSIIWDIWHKPTQRAWLGWFFIVSCERAQCGQWIWQVRVLLDLVCSWESWQSCTAEDSRLVCRNSIEICPESRNLKCYLYVEDGCRWVCDSYLWIQLSSCLPLYISLHLVIPPYKIQIWSTKTWFRIT